MILFLVHNFFFFFSFLMIVPFVHSFILLFWDWSMFASLVFMATEKKRYHCIFVDSAFINYVWDGTDCFSDTFLYVN